MPKETPPRLLREQEFAPCSADNCGIGAFCFANSVASTRPATVCLKSDGLNCRVLDRFQDRLVVALMGLLLHALQSKDMADVLRMQPCCPHLAIATTRNLQNSDECSCLVSDVSPQQAISCALDQVQGRSLLIAALLACLERAFSQGLTSVLRGFWGSGQPQSCIEAPCFGIVGVPGHLQSMQVVWVPIALSPPTGPQSGASDDKAARPAKASGKRKLEAVRRRRIKAPRILK